MQIKNLFKEKFVSISKKCEFHFSPNLGKKKALAVIKQARIKYGSDSRFLYMIAYDLQNIAENGYVTQNRHGFWYDYSEFV